MDDLAAIALLVAEPCLTTAELERTLGRRLEPLPAVRRLRCPPVEPSAAVEANSLDSMRA